MPLLSYGSLADMVWPGDQAANFFSQRVPTRSLSSLVGNG